MRQHLSHYPTCQVPHISGPHSLHLEAFYYLAEDCLYSVTIAAQPTAPLRIWVVASLLVRGKQLNPFLAQLLLEFGLPVGAITYAVAFCVCNKFFNHSQITQIGGGHNYSRYYPRPAHPHVEAKAIEGLLDRMILAKVSFTSIALASLSASELANRHRETIHDSKALITIGLLEKLLPEGFFQLPEVSCLPGEGRAVDECQSRKEMREVAAEIVKDKFVLAQAQILTNYLNSEHLAISKTGLRAPLAQSLVAKMKVEGIVNEAKHVYNESIQVQGKRPPIDGLAITIENASPWTFNFNLKTCTSR
jgi:hypothetical protein